MTATSLFDRAPQARRRTAWLIGGLIVSSLAGSMPARALSCPVGEFFFLTDPVVTLADGPGDAAQEQARWAGLQHAYMEGPQQITFGQTQFNVERAE